MSLKNKFFSILAVAIGIVGFSTFTLAQDSKSTTPAPENGDRHAHGQWNHEKQAHCISVADPARSPSPSMMAF